jgi:hypothetical protein
LARLKAEHDIGWVEALPLMLRQYHDAVGESGYSPYKIVFGRFRNLQGAPRNPPENSHDVRAFFDRQEKIDQLVAGILNTKHEKAIERINRRRPEMAPLPEGTKVWVYRHKKSGGYKMQPRWWGQALIYRWVGSASYVVEWASGMQVVARDDLKEYTVEEFRKPERTYRMSSPQVGDLRRKTK